MIYKNIFFLLFLYYKIVSLQRNVSVRSTYDHGKSRKLCCICCVKSFHTQNLMFWNILNEFLNVYENRFFRIYEKRERKFWSSLKNFVTKHVSFLFLTTLDNLYDTSASFWLLGKIERLLYRFRKLCYELYTNSKIIISKQ
jgi:hypothetical protein